jgi:uncharacterized protein YgiM (DUF1202 family)
MIRQIRLANLVLFTLLAFVSMNGVSAQEDPTNLFPYQAIVSAEGAEVHSGPGSVHYVTAKLNQGDSVEVYRHDPGGWCAIRPNKDSFSLIPATAIEELGHGVGEITEEGSQAWVGTHLGPVEKPLWQVKLKAGEKVTLLGIATWPDPEGFTTSWYQIEPPAGEFRWIKMDNLKLPPAVTAALESQRRQASNRSEDQISNTRDSLGPPGIVDNAVAPAGFDSVAGWSEETSLATQSSPQQRGFESHSLGQAQLRSTGSGWRKARFPIQRSGQGDRPWADLSGAQSGSGSQNVAASQPGLNHPSEPAVPPDRLASADLNAKYDINNSSPSWSTGFSTAAGNLGPLTPRLTELELKLNQEMVKDPNLWRLDDLQVTAQQVATSASDQNEREQAQRFLSKLQNCLNLREQYVRRGSPGMAPLTKSGQAAGSSTSSSDLSLDTLYDAHGWLKELVRDSGRTESTFVLQNDAGKITHHVMAGPGMNLSSYVSKRIGVVGQRGYHTRLKLDHVTVQKVIELK